jgi:hypothetical protein
MPPPGPHPRPDPSPRPRPTKPPLGGPGAGDPGNPPPDIITPRVRGRRVVRHGRFYRFKVAFSGAGGRAASNGPDPQMVELIVSGPNGFSAPAERVGLKVNRRTGRSIGVYRVAAPGGTFDAGDNGAYAVQLRRADDEGTPTTVAAVESLRSFVVRCRARKAAGAIKE